MEQIAILIQAIETEFEEIEKGVLYAHTPIQDYIPFNSMNLVIFQTFLELEFDVKIKPKELKSCITVQDLMDIIAKYRQSHA